MADNREIAYCSARANPIAHVQVADFSHVQYLRVPHSEPEIDDRAGKGEPGEERVGREHHPDPLALQNPPSPKSAQVNSPKLNIQTPQSPQPDETKLEKETAPLASGKKRKNQKKTEKARQKEKEKKADKAKNAAESMASNAESSQTPPSPTANTDPEGPLPSSEATKAESSSPPDQSPDEPEKKEQDIDSKPVAESQPPVEDAKHEETEDGEIKAADVTDVVPAHAPTNESSNTPGPEQPDDPVASEPTPEPVKQPESTHSSVDLPADGPAGKAGEEIALEAAQKPAKADETPVSQPSANSAGDERSATSDSTAADQSPPTEKESRPRDRHANDQGVAGPTPGSDPVVDNSGTGKPGVDSDPLSDNPSAEASADALPSNDQTTIIHEEAEGHAHVEENITAMPESDGATHSEDNGKAEDETEATGAPGPTETEPQAENTPEASVESSAQGKLEQAPQKEDVDTTADGAPAPKDTELEETRLDETNKPKMEENESQNVSAIETIAATLPQTGETEDEPAGRSVEPVVHPEGVVDEAPQPTKEQVTTESEEPHDSLAVDMSSNGNEDANNPAAEPPIPTPGDTHPVEFLNTQDTTESESTTQEGKSSDEPKASSDVESKGNIDESDTNAEDAKQIGEVEGAAGTQEVKPLTLEQACTVAVPLTEDATEVPADEMPANNATENLENIESAPDSEVKPADDGTEVEDAIPLAVQGTKNDASGVSHEITSPSIDSPASEAQGGNSGTQDLSDENTGDSLKPSDSNPENMEGASMGASGDENTQIAIEPLDPPISTNNAEGGPTAGEVSSIPETDDAAKTTVTALDVSPEGETHDTIAAIVAESTEPAASGAQDEPSEEPQKCVDGQATIESSADDPDEGGAAETIEDKYESPPEMSPPEPARPAESTEATEKVASSEAAPELISPEDASTIQDKRESNDDTNTGPPKETPADPMSVKEPATSDEAPEPISPKDASAGQDRPESSDDTKTEPLEETSADAVSVKEPETSEEQPVEEILAPIETTESSGEPVTQEGASPTDENIELESTLPEDQAKNPATPDTTDPPIIQPAEAGNSVEITNAEPLERGETPGENMDVIPTKEHGDIDVPDSEPEAVVASQETPLQETSVVEKHDGVPEDQSDHEPPETTLPTKDVASTPETPELQTSTQVAENTDSKESTDEQVITAAVPENPPLEIKEASLPADKVAVDSLAGETAPTPEVEKPLEESTHIAEQASTKATEAGPATAEDASTKKALDEDPAVKNATESTAAVQEPASVEQTPSVVEASTQALAQEPTSQNSNEDFNSEIPTMDHHMGESSTKENPINDSVEEDATIQLTEDRAEDLATEEPSTKNLVTGNDESSPNEEVVETPAEESPSEQLPAQPVVQQLPPENMSNEPLTEDQTIETTREEHVEEPAHEKPSTKEGSITSTLEQLSIEETSTTKSIEESFSESAEETPAERTEKLADGSGEATKASTATTGETNKSTTELNGKDRSAEVVDPVSLETSSEELAAEDNAEDTLVEEPTEGPTADETPAPEFTVEDTPLESSDKPTNDLTQIPNPEPAPEPDSGSGSSSESTVKPADEAAADPTAEHITEHAPQPFGETTRVESAPEVAEPTEPSVELAAISAEEVPIPQTGASESAKLSIGPVTEEPAAEEGSKESAATEPKADEPVEESSSSEPTKQPAQDVVVDESRPSETNSIDPSTTKEPATEEAMKETAATEPKAGEPIEELSPSEPVKQQVQDVVVEESRPSETNSIGPSTIKESAAEEHLVQPAGDAPAEPSSAPEEPAIELEGNLSTESTAASVIVREPVVEECSTQEPNTEAAEAPSFTPSTEVATLETTDEELLPQPLNEPTEELLIGEPAPEEPKPLEESTARVPVEEACPGPVLATVKSEVRQGDPQHELVPEKVEEPVVDTAAQDQPQETTNKEVTDRLPVKGAVEKPVISSQPEPEKVSEKREAKTAYGEVSERKTREDDESKDTIGPIPSQDRLTRKVSKDDEGRKPTDEAKSSDRHHRHRHHHHHHHHSNHSRESKGSGEHRHHSSRPDSNVSVWTASDHSSTRIPKGRDSGFSLGSSHSSSSQKYRAPDEQLARDRRREERRAERELHNRGRESKGKEPEVPPSARHSYRSSRHHSLPYSERSHSERFSGKEDIPSPNKKFLDTRNAEPAPAPNYAPRPRANSSNDSYLAPRDSPKSSSLKRSDTNKSYRDSADIFRTKSHRDGEHRDRGEYRSRGESPRRRRTETRHATHAEASSSRAAPVSPRDELKYSSKREERQRAREAEVNKKSTGFRAAIKKLFS